MSIARSALTSGSAAPLAWTGLAAVACAVTAALARRAGACPARALAFGLAFPAVPLVMLQLATNYVDLAVAAFLAASVYFARSPALGVADLGAWALATGLLLPVRVALSARLVRRLGARTPRVAASRTS